MPAYQAGAHIQKAIVSCQKQTYHNWELCIVDDGSRDDTYDIAFDLSLEDHRIRVQKQMHSGCAVARNHCLEISTGELIARQDADDLQHARRLEKQIDYLLAQQSIDVVSCGMRYINAEGENISDVFSMREFEEGMNAEKYMRNAGGRPVCASIVGWRDVYARVGQFNPDMTAGSDGEWNFRAIVKGVSWGFVDEPLYVYRQHGQQISGRLSVEQASNHEAARLRYRTQWNKPS